MSLADELLKLEELYRNGALTDEEFARAKATVLGRTEEESGSGLADLGARLDGIAREQQVARVDREWEKERDRHMLTRTEGGEFIDGRHVGGYPVRYLPTRDGSVMGGIGAVAVGIVFMIFAGASGHGVPALFGLVILAFGIGWALYEHSKATEYERAERSYRRRRKDAMIGDKDATTEFLEGLDQSQPPESP